MNRIKLSTLALAVAALAGYAHADDSLSIYGIIDAGVRGATHQPTPKATSSAPASGTSYSMVSGGYTTSRFGFRGKEDLGNGLRAVFQLESSLAVQNGSVDSVLFNRESRVGLTDGRNSIHFGRQYTEAYNSLQQVDPLALHSAANNPNAAVAALNDTSSYGNELAGQTNNRTNSVVRYDGNYGQLKTGAQYSLGAVPGDSSAKSSYGFRASYDVSHVLVSGSASRLHDASDNSLDAYTFGAKWSYTQALALSATYSDQETHNGVANGYNRHVGSIGALYTPNNITYGLAYYNTKADRIGGAAGVDGSQDKLLGLASYSLSKRTSVYSTVDYAVNHNALVPANTREESVLGLAVGLTHVF